jgi:hypothetical protein
MDNLGYNVHRESWKKGKIVGQKAPFKVKDIWALPVRYQIEGHAKLESTVRYLDIKVDDSVEISKQTEI